MNNRQEQEVACQQVLQEDRSVFSVQWTSFPLAVAADLTPRYLLDRYLGYIRKFTLSLIRPSVGPDGVEFRLAATRASLISFLPPLEEPGGVRLRIRGGFLVQPQQCDRGEIGFFVRPKDGAVRATVLLSDYCPLILGGPSPSLLRRWLYRWTQAYIHRVVTVGFLARISGEILGCSPTVRVVRVRERAGEEI